MVLAGYVGAGRQAVRLVVSLALEAQGAQQPGLLGGVELGDAQVEVQRGARLTAEGCAQGQALQPAVAGPAEPGCLQRAGQARGLWRAAQLPVPLHPAVEAEGGQLRGVEIELEQIAGLAVGAVRGQAVIAGGQFDVGPGDARPGDGELPLAAYRLAGDAAVVQREAGIDHRLRCQVAAGLEAGIDVRRRQAAEAARVEVLQFAFGREWARPVEIEFALRQHAGCAGSQLQPGQAQALAGQAGFGEQAEGGVAQVDADILPVAGQCRRQGAGQAGGVQGGQQLPGVEAAGLQVEPELVVAPAAVAGQFAAAGQGGVQGVQRGLGALPAQRAGQGGERQALAVERAGLVIGQAEAADDPVRFRRNVGNQAE